METEGGGAMESETYQNKLVYDIMQKIYLYRNKTKFQNFRVVPQFFLILEQSQMKTIYTAKTNFKTNAFCLIF